MGHRWVLNFGSTGSGHPRCKSERRLPRPGAHEHPGSDDLPEDEQEAYLARLPWRWMTDPTDAAKSILGGVRRNKAIIIFPFYARVLWWCYRIFPPCSSRSRAGA